MREFHVWFFQPWTTKLYNAYTIVLDMLKEGYFTIGTQNLLFCDVRVITKHGYRLFIHPQIGEPFEITLGKCVNTKREIKPETNILKLLLSGEFNTDDCKVVEEVF